MSMFRTMLAGTVACSLVMPPSWAATQTALEPSSVPTLQDELLQMAGQAGVIFVGEVLTVTPHPSFTPGTGTVEVAFRIDRPVRGCEGQTTYILREWAGLWTGGRQRYTPGQRLLVLLHAPSASGLSSPVGGQDGVIPITGTGGAPKPTDPAIAQAEPSVDLRWVRARLPRAAMAVQNSRLHSFTASGKSPDPATVVPRKTSGSGTLRSAVPAPSLTESSTNLPLSSTSSSTSGISLRSILAILGAWQARQSDASR